MRKFVFLIGFILVGIITFGQNYLMTNGTATTCAGNFYDSGGASGNYGKDDDFIFTFTPDTPGAMLQFSFISFKTQNGDKLFIYNGLDTDAQLIGSYHHNQNPPPITATNSDGAITFWFKSVNKHEKEGWSASISCVLIPGLWIGTTSTDWGTTTNWDDGNIPLAGTDVIIPTTPSGGNFPEINSGAGAECNNLLIESGAHFYIPSDNSLTVNGALTNNAGIAGLVIKSDAGGTASLIHNSPSVDATVERYLIDDRWHFIGMPVSSAMAGVFHLPSGHSDIYLRTHTEANNSWGPYIVPVTTPLELGRGYETWVGTPGGFTQPETVKFTGILNSGDYTTGSGGFYGLQYTAGHGLNMISNPYPSALEADIDNWTKSNIANSVWVWSETYGNYVYWNGTDGTGGGTGVGTMTGGIIPAMQGFFVEATGSSPSLTLPQADRLHSSQAYYKESYIPNNTLKLEVDANNYKDIIFVTFNEKATDGYDSQYDVKKLFGLEEAPQLYSMITGQQLSINALSELKEYHTVQLGFECGLPGTYTISTSEIESFSGSVSVYLEDIKEGTIQDLSSKSSYTFDYSLSDNPVRFVLHFGALIGVNELNGQNVKVYANNNVVYIQKPAELEGNVFIYNMMGQEIYSQKAGNEELINIPVNNGTGYYVVKVQSDSRMETQKVFIK